MVAAPLSFPTGHHSGPRPVNLRKDIPQILALLNLAFHDALDGEERRLMNRTSLSQTPWILLKLRQLSHGIVPGFVWEESGDIVGNVSLLTTKIRGCYLVANVAVHPEFRRQGIARNLMETVMESVQQIGGREMLLQVRSENEAAVSLYESLQFHQVGSMTSWYAPFRRFRLLPATATAHSPDHSGGFFIRRLKREEWRTAYHLDTSMVDPNLNWPEPLAEDHYKHNLRRWFSNLLSGRTVETWVAEDGDGQLAGLATILSDWGRLHTLSLRARSDVKERVEQPLLAKLLRRLQHTYRRNIRIDHPADDKVAGDLLRRANFTPRRTLTTMAFQWHKTHS